MVSLTTTRFTVLHNDPTAHQDHCGIYRCQTRDRCLKILTRHQKATKSFIISLFPPTYVSSTFFCISLWVLEFFFSTRSSMRAQSKKRALSGYVSNVLDSNPSKNYTVRVKREEKTIKKILSHKK